VLTLLATAACEVEVPSEASDAATAPGRSVDSGAESAVRALLDDQVAAWNRGDVEGFMAGYWQSDGLRFASGGDVTHGWNATLERYRVRYPDAAAMGRLSFVDIDVEPLGAEHALAFGRYVLERDADRPTGLFTLLLERRPEGWRIVHDHTSAGDGSE
jgi:hypothetical protein